MAEPEYLTAEEVAATCRAHRRTVYDWLKSGKLTAVRAGRKWLITREELRRFLNQPEEQPAQSSPAIAAPSPPHEVRTPTGRTSGPQKKKRR